MFIYILLKKSPSKFYKNNNYIPIFNTRKLYYKIY